MTNSATGEQLIDQGIRNISELYRQLAWSDEAYESDWIALVEEVVTERRTVAAESGRPFALDEDALKSMRADVWQHRRRYATGELLETLQIEDSVRQQIAEQERELGMLVAELDPALAREELGVDWETKALKDPEAAASKAAFRAAGAIVACDCSEDSGIDLQVPGWQQQAKVDTVAHFQATTARSALTPRVVSRAGASVSL